MANFNKYIMFSGIMQRVTIALLCAVVSCATTERFYTDGKRSLYLSETYILLSLIAELVSTETEKGKSHSKRPIGDKYIEIYPVTIWTSVIPEHSSYCAE